MHKHDSFAPKHKKDLTPQQWKSQCEVANLIKEKKSGEVKGQTCADG